MQLLPLALYVLCWTAAAALALPQTSSASITSSLASYLSASATAAGSISANASSSATPTSSAQLPSLSGYSPCVSNCLDLAISQVGCNSVADVGCFCGNATRFVNDITSCVSGQCIDQLANTESLAQQFCNVASPSVSLSFSPLPSTQSSTASGSSAISSASTSTPSSASTASPSSGSTSSTSSLPSPSQSGNTNQSSGAGSISAGNLGLCASFTLALGLGAFGMFL